MRARFLLVPLALVTLLLGGFLFVSESRAPALLAVEIHAPERTRLETAGLERPVEILKDVWGISHIYAETEHDLFFAQGYNAARDRLFQFEVWRRQATGTVAEILGEGEIERDRGARLFRFRGDLETELDHYHPRGSAIIHAFVDGVNAWIDRTRDDPSLLPIEFEMLDIEPQHWTPEVVISRHQGLLMNVTSELDIGRAVAAIGPEAVGEISYFHPGDPELALDPEIDGSLLGEDILALYDAFRGPIRFRPEHVAPRFRATTADGGLSAVPDLPGVNRPFDALERSAIGSNNWVVDGSRTLSGNPIMANDPHRVQAAPSLRYLVHLVGPGWNVIGGGEPVLPGVSIGHNEYGAWGLTVFLTDAEDLYVYRTEPGNPDRYWYRGGWEEMRTIDDAIEVKGGGRAEFTHKYTRHGPVVYEDPANHVAYAVRAGWMEVGGSPYLASLRMDQAKSWEEFREACNYSNIPGENMIWADVDGNIGWQAVGIAPIRRNWSGLVPVPGDGRYEWDGFLEIRQKPHVLNPPGGFWATANEDNVPADYEHPDAVGFEWSDGFRSARIGEVLASGRRFTISEMIELQTDYVSLPARSLVPMLRKMEWPADGLSDLRHELLDWDFELRPESRKAAIYVAWERQVQRQMAELAVPAPARRTIRDVSMKKIIDWLAAPPAWLAPLGDGDPIAGRDEFVRRTFLAGLEDLSRRFGSEALLPDSDALRYGDVRFKHVLLRHPLSGAVNEEMRRMLEVGPAPRGGNGYTVGQTGFGDNQTSGASFRLITEAGDWDAAVFANTPGQVGDPASPMYRNLFDGWARDGFFPLYYTRDRIEAALAERIALDPASR